MQLIITLPTLIIFLLFYWLIKYIFKSVYRWYSGEFEPFSPFSEIGIDSGWNSGYHHGRKDIADQLQHHTNRLAEIADSMQADTKKFYSKSQTPQEPTTNDRKNTSGNSEV